MPLIDLTGKKIGSLTIIERDYEYGKKTNMKKPPVYWKWVCDCGRTGTSSSYNLRHSPNPRCEHCRSGFKDLTGQKFDSLTVLEDDGTRSKDNKRILWKCQCECGNIVHRDGNSLQNGQYYHSCGCRQNVKQMKDITGQVFGKLIALKPNFTYKKEKGLHMSGTAYWDCQCECRTIVTVAKSNLEYGFTSSCGKCIISKGEEKIKEILIENKISFETQKCFRDCRDKQMLPFDFYIENRYIVEFDGKQHQENCKHTWKDAIKTREHDKIKNQYCFEHNIPIIRIPYTRLNSLCLDDLLLKTSQYILLAQVDEKESKGKFYE